MNLEEIKTLIKRGSERLNKFFYVGVVIGIIMGPGTIAGAFIPDVRKVLDVNEDQIPMVVGFGVLMTIIFIVALIEQYNKYRKDNILLTSLERNPENIIWVYKEISTGKVTSSYGLSGATVARFNHVHFHMANGAHSLVWLNKSDAERLVALLRATFPHISLGYAPAIREAYKKDPESLRQHPQHSDAVKEVTGQTKL